MTKLVICLLLLPGAALPASWSGMLVKSGCWISEQHNVNPTDTELFVDQDRSQEIRYCRPDTRTKSFILVLPDGLWLKLDSSGNAQAANLVRNAGKQPVYRAAITGTMSRDTIGVGSIALLK